MAPHISRKVHPKIPSPLPPTTFIPDHKTHSMELDFFFSICYALVKRDFKPVSLTLPSMKKNKKVLLGGLALVVVLGIAFFANSGELFKGNLNTVSGSSSSNTASTSLGTLSFAPSFNPVLDDKAQTPQTSGIPFILVARYRIFATGEPFVVTQLTVANDSSNPQVNNGAVQMVSLAYPTQMSAPTTMDGVKTATLSSGVATFTNLNIAVPASVVDENSINVEVRVVTAGIGSGTMQGNHVELDLNGSYIAVGQTSGGTATGSALLDAPQIALYKSIPTFAKHTTSTVCPASGLSSSSQTSIYCLSVTASVTGPIGLRKLTFDVVPSFLNVSNAPGGLRAPNGFKLYQYDASGNVSTTVSGQGTWSPNSNKAYINIVPETVIPAGTTSYFVLRAPITSVASGGNVSNISTRLSEEPPSYNTAHQPSTSVALAAPNRFNIWSDRSAASHSFNSADWTHSYKLDGLPSAYLFLSQ